MRENSSYYLGNLKRPHQERGERFIPLDARWDETRQFLAELITRKSTPEAPHLKMVPSPENQLATEADEVDTTAA